MLAIFGDLLFVVKNILRLIFTMPEFPGFD
jgi:hypothetical protein